MKKKTVKIPLRYVDTEDLEIALNKLKEMRQALPWKNAIRVKHGKEAIIIHTSIPAAYEVANKVTIYSLDFVPEEWISRIV